jgi:hypothetical protein
VKQIINAVKDGSSALKAFGTLLKSIGKLLLNALTDMVADAFLQQLEDKRHCSICKEFIFYTEFGAIAM